MVKVEYCGVVEDNRTDNPSQLLDRRILKKDLQKKKSDIAVGDKGDGTILSQFKDHVNEVFKEQKKRLAAINSELSQFTVDNKKGKRRKMNTKLAKVLERSA